MRYYLTPVKIAIIQKTTNCKCWQRCGKKEIFVHCWWESQLVDPLWKTLWMFLKLKLSKVFFLIRLVFSKRIPQR